VVRGGDTLFSIATLNRSTVEAVLAANGLTNANLIFVGQQLVIPVPANTPNSTPASGATSTPTGGSNANPNATATTVPVQGQGTYVVQAGEGLYSIAVRFNTTVEALAALNNITNPNQIRAGTILRVPAVTTPTTGNPGTGGPTTPPSTHTVRAGENLFRIGLQYNVTVDALALANRLTNANVIYAGQVLVIPR
jgi:LysM repeat protein